jgi:hypothetical protein
VTQRYDAVVIGGGAAGLFCGMEAGKLRRRVLVLERNAQVGRKIIISGGGRCNFTNINTSPDNFISRNPHFAKSALARYTPSDFVELVRKHRIEFYEKKLGQLFCRESSKQIVEMLLKECAAAKVEIRTGSNVERIEKNERFSVSTNAGEIECDNLIVAAGGLSFPKIGATDFGYSIARQFGLEIVETRPSLVPLVFRSDQKTNKLAGISIDCLVSSGNQNFRENVLFTHRGLSGPAILQISNYWSRDQPVSINLFPEHDTLELLEENRNTNQTTANFLRRFLPERFVTSFVPDRTAAKPLVQLDRSAAADLAEKLNNWQVMFSRTEGFDKAEVTLGGVSTNELSSRSMEAKKVPGLFFIGEVVDVTGWLGGYNFQWAWASGYAAARSL